MRLICLFQLGLPSLPFSSSLVKLAATRNDFLHNPRELQRTSLPCWFEPAKRLLLQICSKKRSPAKKRRGRDALMTFCLIFFFFAPFIFIKIPHNYVIPQAMLQAISQTQSAFYPHRSQTYLKTPLPHLLREPQADTFDTFSKN